MICAGTNTIAALLAGAADPAVAERLEVHLDQCPSCRRLVAELGRGLSLIEGRTLPDRLPQVGERIGRYDIRRVIGVGGMGVVYEAHDTTLDRRVAVKLLRPDLLGGPSLLAEAQAMARLQHPNIVTVHDAGIANGQLYVCMEYVAGSTLRNLPAHDWRAITRMYMDAGDGLAYVHRAGLVHLDFKPDNVLVDRDGRVRVTDFGLARMVDANPMRGMIVGTPAYMAPEQRAGQATDARTDQFAFCASLRESLERVRAPGWLHRVIARGLAERPADRFATMDALLAAIAHGLARRPAKKLVAVGLVAAAIVIATSLPRPARVVTVERPGADRVRIAYRDRAAPVDPAASPMRDMVPPISSDPAPATSTIAPAPGAFSAAHRGFEARRAPVLHVEPPSSIANLDTEDDDAPEAGTCDDGSPLACTLWTPACPAGSTLAIQHGCWTCADVQTCGAIGFPRTCNDGTPLRCAHEPPACPGRQVAAIRNGCWSCQDPFTCWSRTLQPSAPPPRKPPKPPKHPTHTGSATGSGAGSSTGSNTPVCGNGFCEAGEDHASCANDCCELDAAGACRAACGNGFCEAGEDHASCASDCCELGADGACVPVCGNGFCEAGETCPTDCS